LRLVPVNVKIRGITTDFVEENILGAKKMWEEDFRTKNVWK
jgi:hypothetical protein